MNDVSIVEIKQLNYAHPSDWEGKLSNGLMFYARYRWESFRLFIYESDHTFSFFCDSPLIEIPRNNPKLKSLLDSECLPEEGMLELCNLKID